MTPAERAGKICNTLDSLEVRDTWPFQEWIAFVATEIREAEADARTEALGEYLRENHIPHDVLRKAAKVEAFEEVAKVIEELELSKGQYDKHGYVQLIRDLKEKL